MSMFGDEFTHMVRQAAAQGVLEYRPHLYGHIASYDPLLHRVRCIVPSLTDDSGSPLLTPWMPMGTLSGGSGHGIQVVYKGGANVSNPTAGEQVQISLFDRTRGVAAVPCTFFHQTNRPPSTNLPKKESQSEADSNTGWAADAPPIEAGDILISTPPPEGSGDAAKTTLIRLRANGDIELWGRGNVGAVVIGNLNATVTDGDISVDATNGKVDVTAHGDVTITCPTVKIVGDLHVSGEVVAGFAGTDEVNLQTHRHGLGAAVAGTSSPTPGT